MKYGRGVITLSIFAIGLFPAAASRAAVTLGFQMGGTTPTTVTELPGSSFLLSVVLAGAGEQLVGLDYHFLASTSGVFSPSGVFTVLTRNSATGAFTNPYKSDLAVMTGNQVLQPDTSFNLGANTTNFTPTTASATTDVADYLIQVSPLAPRSKFTFSFSNINGDVLGYDTPSFTEAAFGSTGSFIVVTPEPQCIALIGLGLIGLRRHRRRPTVAMECSR